MEKKDKPADNSNSGISKKVDLEAVKSIFYMFNAKPDTQIKIFKDPKLISYSDIINLNERVQRKLYNHDVHTSMVNVDILLENGDIRSFGTWGEFKATYWDDITIETESISIIWDVNIKLPHYENPQRHTMKVRLGSPLKPNEFFQMMFTSDDDAEIKQSIAPVICKIDFINNIIASELIYIVEDWYNGLMSNKPKNYFQRFIEKYSQQVARLTHILIIVTVLFIVFYFFKLQITSLSEFIINADFIISGYFWIIITLISYLFANFLGSITGQRIFKTIDKIEDYPLFSLTKGDTNKISKTGRINKNVTKSILLQVIFALLGAILSVFLDKLL